MPAASGSPTQNESSVASLADLAGLPDDAYMSGDQATVQIGTAIRTYRLNRGSVAVPDGNLIIAAFSGNGNWEIFPGPAETTLSQSAAIEPAAPVAIPGVLGSVLSTAAMVAPAGGVVEVSATLQLTGGADGVSLAGHLDVVVGANPAAQLEGSEFGNAVAFTIAAAESEGLALSGRRIVAPGDSVVFRVMMVDSALNPTGVVQGAYLVARFFPY